MGMGMQVAVASSSLAPFSLTMAVFVVVFFLFHRGPPLARLIIDNDAAGLGGNQKRKHKRKGKQTPKPT